MTNETPEYKLEMGIPVPQRSHGVGIKSPIRLALEKLHAAPAETSIFFEGVKSVTVSGIATSLGSGWYTTRSVRENGRNGIRVWRRATEPKEEAANEPTPRGKNKGIITRNRQTPAGVAA